MVVNTNYKYEHEQFMSNLKGSSAACIVACLLHVPVFVMLTKLIQKGRKPRLLREFFFLCLPLLLTMTIFADYTYLSLFIGLITAASLYQSQRRRIIAESSNVSSAAIEVAVNNSQQSHHPPAHQSKYQRTSYLTLSKGATVLFTCLAILAVDFRVFPRRYGKTEMFGVSLMDYGVGSFMISTACTSKFARGLATGGFREAFSMKRFAVLMLGISRLVSVKLLNYQEHVSEYGLHWNFFVTLFCVWVTADIVHAFFTRKVILVTSICVLIAYQWVLKHTELTEYVFSSTRTNLLDANKEGIVSLFGYIPLYLIMEVVAFHFFHFDTSLPDMVDTTSATNSYNNSSSPIVSTSASTHITANSNNNTTTNAAGATTSTSTAISAIDDIMHMINPSGASAALLSDVVLATSSNDYTHHTSTQKNADMFYSVEIIEDLERDDSDQDDKQRNTTNASNSHRNDTNNHSESTTNREDRKNRDNRRSFAQSKAKSQQGHHSTTRLSHNSISNTVINQNSNNSMVTVTLWDMRFIRRLSLLTLLFWLLWLGSAAMLQPTSRRLCNMTYVCFSLAMSCTLILGTYFADVFGGQTVPIVTLSLMNQHSLIVFLIANVLTGVVNMLIQTIYSPPIYAVMYLSMYTFIVTCIPWTADKLLALSVLRQYSNPKSKDDYPHSNVSKGGSCSVSPPASRV